MNFKNACMNLSLRVRITKSSDDVMAMCPTIVTEDSMQAQHLAATLALYHLTKGQVRFSPILLFLAWNLPLQLFVIISVVKF